jgi:hypothetical protein
MYLTQSMSMQRTMAAVTLMYHMALYSSHAFKPATTATYQALIELKA